MPPAGYPAPRTGLAPLPPPPDSRPQPSCSELGGFSWAGSCRRLCVARCDAVGNPAVNFSRVPCAGTLAQLHGLREVASGDAAVDFGPRQPYRSEEHTSELQSLMRISYAVFCLKKKKIKPREYINIIAQHI